MADGTLEPVRCGASNRCQYCASLAALEAGDVLMLDAKIRMPTVGLTTTTRDPRFDTEQLKKAERNLWRALRKLMPLEYCGFVEWTTGEGTHSDGFRRPHIHHLVKGIPLDHELMAAAEDPETGELLVDRDGRPIPKLEVIVSELWRRYTGDAFVVECRPLKTPLGALKYMALHYRKRAQAPPPTWKGRRLRPSKGYYEQPVAELRALSRQLNRDQRLSHLAEKAVGALILPPEEEQKLDAELTTALVAAMRDLSANPLDLQLNLNPKTDGYGPDQYSEERIELIARTKAIIEEMRERKPAELVRVREVEEVDRETGVTFRRAVAVIGPLPPREAKRIIEREHRL